MMTLYPSADGSIESLYAVAQRVLQEYLAVLDISFSSSAVDVTPKGITKGSGLAFFCQKTGIAPSEILAIGDSHNDLSMLEIAGHIACPGNATDEVRSRVASRGVDGYVAKAHTTAGVVQVLEHFFGIELPDPRLLQYSFIVTLRKKRNVMCASIPAACIHFDETSMRVSIPDDPYIAANREQMSAISKDSHGSQYRWAAGGIAPILSTPDGDFLITIYRDEQALTWPNTLTIPTGLYADSDEFVDVDKVMAREGFEEFIILGPLGLIGQNPTHSPVRWMSCHSWRSSRNWRRITGQIFQMKSIIWKRSS